MWLDARKQMNTTYAILKTQSMLWYESFSINSLKKIPLSCEKYALKMLRDDFNNLENGAQQDLDPKTRPIKKDEYI